MRTTLFAQAAVKFALGLLLSGALIFLPAGTLDYWNGWLFLCTLFPPMLLLGVVLLIRDPALLGKRLRSRESQGAQTAVVALSGLMFVAGFVTAGLDFRFGWSRLPRAASLAASALCLLAYLAYWAVLRENAFLSRTVEVQAHQHVVDTGPYGVVRHPMYSATILLFLSFPLILGSLYALLLFLPYPALIAVRIKHEEALLERELEGYVEYKGRVKYRLIPFLW